MVNSRVFDLIVIGSGPGGYVAAIKAAQLGQKVAVVERKDIGGTCLNVGCIPSKSYIQHAHWVLSAQAANKFGIHTTVGDIDFEKLVERKNGVVKTLQGGVGHLFKSNKIEYIEGSASVTKNKEVIVDGKTYHAKNILLATGSRPFVPPINGVKDVDYLTTDTFFSMTELPKKFVVIGGGIIAVELAFAMKPLGVDVTLLEVAPDILLTEDEAAREVIKKKLKKLGIVVHVGVHINDVTKSVVKVEGLEDVSYDKLLVATGRRADLTIANALGLELDDSKRFVKVDHHYQTSLSNVFAIGDLIPGLMLAHVASAEGIRIAEHLAGQPITPVNKDLVPKCLYTDPEIASFGLNEKEAKEQGYDVVVKQMAFGGNGRAIASVETDGFVKIISEKKYHQILGAVIVGSHATEMIHTILAVREAEGTVDELAHTIFAHPTLSEVVGETANAVLFRPIHG